MRHVDSPATFAACTKSRFFSESACPRRMRASNAQSVEAEDEHHRPHAARLQVAGDDDQQRDRRDDEEDVGQEVDDLVDDAAASRRRGCRGSPRAPSRAPPRRTRGSASGGRRATTCEKMSLPWSVVPNRWCHDGAWRVARMLKSVGLSTEIQRRDQRDDHHEPDEQRCRTATSGCERSSGASRACATAALRRRRRR